MINDLDVFLFTSKSFNIYLVAVRPQNRTKLSVRYKLFQLLILKPFHVTYNTQFHFSTSYYSVKVYC